MDDEFWNELYSDDPTIQKEAWFKLAENHLEKGMLPTDAEFVKLEQRLQTIQLRDASVWRVAMTTMHILQIARLDSMVSETTPSGGGSQPSAESDEPVLIANWMFDPFKGPSVVLYLSELKRARDADASVMVARRLPWTEFRSTEFIPCVPDSRQTPRLNTELKAACVLGRINLYGKVIRKLEADAKSTGRFDFPLRERPEGYEPGKLIPGYHRIRERGSCLTEKVASKVNVEVFKYYDTTEDDEDRIDYALIKVCPTQHESNDVHLVIIQGASTLGTLGATKFAVRKLFDNEKYLLPEPKQRRYHNAGRNSLNYLEALVRVTAKKADYPLDWQAINVELVKLFMGRDRAWENEFTDSTTDNNWHVPQPNEIALVYDVNEPGRLVSVLLDGVASGMQPESGICIVLSELCKLCYAKDEARNGRGARVTYAELIAAINVKDRTLLDGKKPPEQILRNNLSLVSKRYLWNALQHDNGSVMIDADILIIDTPEKHRWLSPEAQAQI